METLGAHGNPLAGYPTPLSQSRLEHRSQSGGDDDPMSDNDMSRDGDSNDGDAMSRVPATDIDQETMETLRQQEREEREEIEKELRAQNEAFMAATVAAAGGTSPLSHLAGLNIPGLMNATDNNGNSGGIANKEPPPLGLAGLEAFRREYLTSPLSQLRANSNLVANFPSMIPQLGDRSPFGKAMPSTPGGGGGSRTPPTSSQSTPSSEFSSQQNWSFEEQFKQLYELSDDQKRKEFLDELFAFMQKRGTPINRLPIMAKQVLDLYELYNLVTARGGLVEVINKKQWQEIIKGLNLPSSITSAAFTLRTQYTKYLYPYECRMKNLSSPSELQAAIDGNRREGTERWNPQFECGATAFSLFPDLGRRSGYEGYNMFSGPRPQVPMPPSSMSLSQISPLPMRPSFNGAGFPGSNFIFPDHGKSSPPGMNPGNPLSALEMTRLALFKMYNQAGLPHGPPPPGLPPGLGHAGLEMGRAMAEQQARAIQAVREAEHRAEKEKEAALAVAVVAAEKQRDREQREQAVRDRHRERDRSREDRVSGGDRDHVIDDDDDISPSSSVKRERQDSFEGRSHNGSPIGGANIRIANRGEGGDSSLVVSLEINSVVYQGVLFAQPKSRSRSRERKENRISS